MLTLLEKMNGEVVLHHRDTVVADRLGVHQVTTKDMVEIQEDAMDTKKETQTEEVEIVEGEHGLAQMITLTETRMVADREEGSGAVVRTGIGTASVRRDVQKTDRGDQVRNILNIDVRLRPVQIQVWLPGGSRRTCTRVDEVGYYIAMAQTFWRGNIISTSFIPSA